MCYTADLKARGAWDYPGERRLGAHILPGGLIEPGACRHPSIHPPINLFSQYMLLKLTLSQALFWSLRTTVNKTGKLSAPWELHLKGSIPETSQITHYALQVETDGSSLSYEGSVLPSPPALIHTDTFTVGVNVPQGVHAYVCSQCICLDTSVSTRSLGIHTH